MIDIEKERKAFEMWASIGAEMHRQPSGEYSSHFTRRAWAAWQARASMVDDDVRRDAELLDALAREYWDLRSFSMPTGNGDADVGWKVTQNTFKGDHEVACVYHDDPRAALQEAFTATYQQPAAKGEEVGRG